MLKRKFKIEGEKIYNQGTKISDKGKIFPYVYFFLSLREVFFILKGSFA